MFTKEKVIDAATKAGNEDLLRWAHACSVALAAHQFDKKIIEIKDLGEFEILIKVAEGLPKKVFFIRNGMFITDHLKRFGAPLTRFPNTKEFVVIVRPKTIDAQSSSTLKRMENPEHNEFSTGFISDPDEGEKLNSAMKKLNNSIRAIIKDYAAIEESATREISDLNQFFSDKTGTADPGALASEDQDPANVVVTTAKPKKPKPGPGLGPGPGPRPGPGPGPGYGPGYGPGSAPWVCALDLGLDLGLRPAPCALRPAP
jgi:hypothetical protein